MGVFSIIDSAERRDIGGYGRMLEETGLETSSIVRGRISLASILAILILTIPCLTFGSGGSADASSVDSRFGIMARICGNDGGVSALTVGQAGAIYGAASLECNPDYPVGYVFELTPPVAPPLTYSITTLGGFLYGSQSEYPSGSVALDRAGNIYGSAGGFTYGSVYELSKDGLLTTLHSFDLSDGATPSGRLAIRRSGVLYGVTYFGGANSNGFPSGDGTIFSVDQSGRFKTLVFFDGANGANPVAGLLADRRQDGVFYGTTSGGGNFNSACPTVLPSGCGTVFKLSLSGASATLTTLYAFSGPDGSVLNSPLIADNQGNLYGTTALGGSCNAGTVFELTPQNELITLYNFGAASNCADDSDGKWPGGDIARDAAGNIYGTTSLGGINERGTLFQISPNGALTTLHTFMADSDGVSSGSGVVLIPSEQTLYGIAGSLSTNTSPVFAYKLRP